MAEAEKRLGFRQILAEVKSVIEGLMKDEVRETEKNIYDRLVELFHVEGHPTESNEDFKEANVNDLVLTIIVPIGMAFKSKTGRDLHLHRGHKEFALVELVGAGPQKFVFVVEAKKSSLGEAKRQCLLAMKNIGEDNGGSVVYGFVTTEEQWQIIRYDGTVFTQTENLLVLFRELGQDRKKWIKESSIIVDCIHGAFRSGGFVVDN
ncbi:hypothetical protein HOY82DRAFT_535565 [Tuber indicum]|nr:hypothetical protein HOY82DRAFT_535565 [Tuber indicum]